MIAIKKGDNYALETLIKRYGYKGIDFNTKVDKETPLFLASRLGQNECVKTLIEYGADTEIEGCGEQTPLDVINRNRYVETFKTLYNKKHDAKVNYE